MIYCNIEGHTVYPLNTDKIKVTLENQYLKDSSEYTYNISFPMDIMENRLFFGNINRIDVRKNKINYDICRLYADDRLVIEGKGSVNSITNDVVKMQIIGGKSKVKYNSKFLNHNLRDIPFPSVIVDKGLYLPAYKMANPDNPVCDTSTPPDFIMDSPRFHGLRPKVLYVNLDVDPYVGQEDVAIFQPVNDEMNDRTVNLIIQKTTSFTLRLGAKTLEVDGNTCSIMEKLSVQPFLMYVLRKVLEYEGYTLTQCDFDCEPWNRLVIANADETVNIAESLPRWTVYHFIDEVRKLFNASIIFDELNKTVKMVYADELTNQHTCIYDCSDEYECEYDEDGLSTLETSNVEYALSDSAYHEWYETISSDVLKNFSTNDYGSVSEIISAAEAMTTREKLTTIFRVGHEYYIFTHVSSKFNEDEIGRRNVGYFMPLYRDIEDTSSITLNIVPVAMCSREQVTDEDKSGVLKGLVPMTSVLKRQVYIPSLSARNDYSDMTEDENGEYYYSVADAMQGSFEETKEEDNDDIMQLMFRSDYVYSFEAERSILPGSEINRSGKTANGADCYPIVYTNDKELPFTSRDRDKGCLSLYLLHRVIDTEKNNSIDTNNKLTVKIITDDIPDPSRIYVINNKRYLCEKIEMEVTSSGIDKVKTAYLYGLL